MVTGSGGTRATCCSSATSEGALDIGWVGDARGPVGLHRSVVPDRLHHPARRRPLAGLNMKFIKMF